MFPWALLVLMVVAGLPILLYRYGYEASMRKQRRDINAQFDSLEHVDGENARGSYYGNSAVIVYEFDDEPRIGNRRAYRRLTIHRVFRNTHGEYFLFISGVPPYVTHLSRERAMNALRENKLAFHREFGDESTT